MKNRFPLIPSARALGNAPAPPPPTNVSWKSAVSGDWTNAADWSGGVMPGASNDVTIGVAGNYTVSITTSDAAHSLTIGNAGITVADNGGALAITTKLNLSAGTLALSGGSVTGGTVSIAAAGVVTSTGNNTLTSAVADLGNVTISPGLLELDGGGSLGGTISGAGTLGLGGGGIFTTSGLSETATLAIYNGAVLTSSAASGTIHGPVAFSGNGTLAVANHDTLTLSAGVTTGAADSDIGRGNSSGPGTVTTHGVSNLYTNGADVSLYLGGGVTWVNGGTVNDNGIVYLNFVTNDTVSIVNNAGASFNFVSDYAQFQLPNSGTDKFSNAGTLAKTGGTGVSTLQAVLTNTGLINVVSGVLELDSGGALGGTLSGAGTLGFSGGSFTTSGLSGGGTIAVYNNASLTGTTASATVAGAAVLYNNGTLAAASHDTLTISGGLTTGAAGSDIGRANFSGPGTVTTNGVSNLYTNGADVSLYLGGGVTWVNGGTVNDNGIICLNFTGGDTVSIVNNADASFNFVSDFGQFELPNSGTDKFSNAGTLAKTGGTGVSALDATITNTGLINAASGVLELDAGGALGGTLTGAGTLGLGLGSFTTSGLSGGGTLAVYNSASLTGTTATAIIAGSAVLYSNGTLAAASHDTLTISGGITTGAAGGSDAGRGNLAGPGTVTTNGVSNLLVNGADVSLWLGGGVTWVNGGTVNDNGIIYLNFTGGDTVSIVNNAGASFNLLTDYAQFQLPNSGTDNFTNAGTLAKTGGSGTSSLVMNLSNSGIVSAASGTLHVVGNVSNTGLLLATGGGTLDLSQAALSNLPGTTLTGGAYEADLHSILQLADNASIVTDSAAITLSGAGSAIQSLNTGSNTQTALESTLAGITEAGGLTLLNGRNYTNATVNFADNGLLSLGGVRFTVKTLAVGATGTVSGYGTISATVTDAGAMAATGGTLVLAGTVTGAGTLSAAAGATLDLTRGGALSEVIAGAGTLELSGTTAYTLAGATIATAALAIDAGATLSSTGTIAGGLADTGTLAASGGILSVSGAATGTGLLSAAAGATLDLTAGGNFVGLISGAGTLQLDGATALVAQDANLSVAAVKIDAGATLELAGGGSLGGSLAGAGTLQLDGTANYTLTGASVGAAHIAVGTGAVVTGNGTFAGAVLDSGTLLASGGSLLVSGSVSGAGVWQAAAGAILDLAGGGSLSGTLSGAGTLQLDGPAALVLQAGATLSVASVLVNSGATLNLNGGGSLGGSLFGAGTLQLDGGAYTLAGATLGTGIVRLDANSSLSGPGTISGALANNGTVSTLSGTLLVSGAVSGSGAYAVGTGSTLDLAGGGAVANVSGAGTLHLDGATGFTIADAGTLKAAADALGSGASASATGTLSGTLADAGTLTAASGTLALVGALSGAGTLAAIAGAVLDIQGGGAFAGALAGAGSVRIDSALTLNAGASLTASAVVQTANVILGSGTSLTNLAADSYTITAAAGKTVSLTGAAGDKLTNAGTLVANGAGTESIGVAVINTGNITVGSGSLSFAGAITNNGVIDASGAVATFKLALGGSGTVDIDHGGTVSLLKGGVASSHIDFGVGGGLLDLTNATTFKGTIQDFAVGDTIDLLKEPETSYNFANGVLTVKNGTQTVAALHFAGTYTNADFTLASDGHGGSFITHT